MQIRLVKLFTASVALGAALTACSDGGTGAGRGTLSLAITDAPFPFDSVKSADVFIVRIDAKRADVSVADADDETKNEERRQGESDERGRGWVTVATPNRAINLLELRNGKVMNLGEQSLPTGDYKGFRLIIDASKSGITLVNGTRPSIVWPSAARSGIKVKLESPVTLTENGSLMVLDFDLGNSFVMRGNSISRNGLLFKPVIRAVARDIAGSIGGTVRAGTATGATVSGATVQVWRQLADTAAAGSVPVATAGSDAAGAYKVSALVPGSYGLRVLPPAGSANQQAVVPSVTVTTGTTAAADIVLP